MNLCFCKLLKRAKLSRLGKLGSRSGAAFLTFMIGVAAVSTGFDDHPPAIQKPGVRTLAEPSRILTDEPLASEKMNEEYAVFSAVLAQIYRAQMVVISDRVSNPFPAEPDRFPELTGDTLSDYQKKNRTQQKLENKFTFNGPVILLSQEEENRLFPKGGAGWDEFYRQFPPAKGIVYLSNVGFNRRKDQALVRVTHQCGGFCDEYGSYYFLQKMKNNWIVQRASGGSY